MNDQPRSSTIKPRYSGQRTGLAVEDIKLSLINNLFYGMGRVSAIERRNNLYTALALTVRERAFHQRVHTIESLGKQQPCRVVAVSEFGCDVDAWTRKSIPNLARMGKFSSDRSIGEYCDQIWNVKPVQEKVG